VWQRDRHDGGIYHARIASHSKNVYYENFVTSFTVQHNFVCLLLSHRVRLWFGNQLLCFVALEVVCGRQSGGFLLSILTFCGRAQPNPQTHACLFCLDSRWYRYDTLRHKLHRSDLSPYLLQRSLYNVETTDRPNGVWALSFIYVVVSNISWCL